MNHKSLKNLFVLFLLVLFPALLKGEEPIFYSKYLVSNIPENAINFDANLKNPWGLVIHDGELYVANNGSNTSTAYDKKGNFENFLINVKRKPTGLVHNHFEDAFEISNHHDSYPAEFIFCTETGKILAYSEDVDAGSAVLVVDGTPFGTVYTGLAIAESDDEPFLYATDFKHSKIDMFDKNFNYVRSFSDFSVPSDYGPFNIKVIDEKLYVTFARQSLPDRDEEKPGPGTGYVTVFTPEGNMLKRLISKTHLNAPWGIAQAPEDFGEFAEALLIGNFGNGRINAFDIETGEYLGTLRNIQKKPIVIPGLWALEFEDHHHKTNALYFTAGPNEEHDGVLGFIKRFYK